MTPMQLTEDELRLVLYALTAFRDNFEEPERVDADLLVDRIQQHRGTVPCLIGEK